MSIDTMSPAREKVYTAIRMLTGMRRKRGQQLRMLTGAETEAATKVIILIMQDVLAAGDLLVAEMPDEDDIEQAITDSIDLDWTPRDAAKAVVRLLQTGVNGEGSNGEHLERCCPNDPKNDPKNENIDDSLFDLLLSALTDLERYLRDTPHHNSMQAAAARYAINKAGG